MHACRLYYARLDWGRGCMVRLGRGCMVIDWGRGCLWGIDDG